MNVDVTEVAKKVKEFAEKHAYTFTAEEKKYVPLEVWQYAARLHGWSIRIAEVKKEGADFTAKAEAVEKGGAVAGSGVGCVAADEPITGTYARMKLAQHRAVSCMLVNTLSDVMKLAGYDDVAPHLTPTAVGVKEPEPPEPTPMAAVTIQKKPLDHFVELVWEYTDKLSLMVDKLSILDDAKKEGLDEEDMRELEWKIEKKYGEL
jgi:hypothetical protein